MGAGYSSSMPDGTTSRENRGDGADRRLALRPRPLSERFGGNQRLPREHGMKFGLWMEPERIGLPSHRIQRLAFSPRHGSLSGLLDMTNPEAAAWAEEQVARCITEYKMDLLRIDYNISSAEYFHVKNKYGMMEDQSIRHFDAVYEMYKRLKLRFPDVVFENCASGGARTDIGIMRYFSHTWVSDNQVAPVSLMITNGMTAALPPERVDRLVSGMGCHTAADLAFHFRNAMLGHLSLNVLGPRTAVMNDAAFEFAAHEVAIYKNSSGKSCPIALFSTTPKTIPLSSAASR